MGIVEEYQRQFEWRRWDRVFRILPDLSGAHILDLGCGVGDLAAEFVRRGARVTGLDGNAELIQFARERGLVGGHFHVADLRDPPPLSVDYDGIWMSFTAAYFPDLVPRLHAWSNYLRPGGWICMVEVDDLFGHHPISEATQLRIDSYVQSSLDAKRYDFRMGRKLPHMLEDAGFQLDAVVDWDDVELSFSGPARPDVLAAWRSRWARMTLLRDHCGEDFEAVRDDFLSALSSPEHTSSAKVVVTLAHKPVVVPPVRG